MEKSTKLGDRNVRKDKASLPGVKNPQKLLETQNRSHNTKILTFQHQWSF